MSRISATRQRATIYQRMLIGLRKPQSRIQEQSCLTHNPITKCHSSSRVTLNVPTKHGQPKVPIYINCSCPSFATSILLDSSLGHQYSEAAFTLSEFIRNLSFHENRRKIHEESPVRQLPLPAIGIIVVSSMDGMRAIAKRVLDVANGIVETMDSEQSALPSNGQLSILEKCFLQHQHIDTLESFLKLDRKLILKDFYACIEWGYHAYDELTRENFKVLNNYKSAPCIDFKVDVGVRWDIASSILDHLESVN
jgi:hypothetical protein